MNISRYAEIYGLKEEELWGIRKTPSTEVAPNPCWKYQDRVLLERALLNAKSIMEKRLNFPLGQSWIVDEEVRVSNLILLKHYHLQAIGTKTITSETVTATLTDPMVIETDAEHAYHDGLEIQFTRDGDNITFPLCRLLKREYLSVDTELDYSDQTLYDTDITLESWTTTETPATLVWHPNDTETHTRTTETVHIISKQYGQVCLDTTEHGTTDAPYAKISYQCGLDETPEIEDAICHLAHTLMQPEACPYQPLRLIWADDRRDAPSPCPWGKTLGAYLAWMKTADLRIWRSYLL